MCQDWIQGVLTSHPASLGSTLLDLPSPGGTLLPLCIPGTQDQGATDTERWALSLRSSGGPICPRVFVQVPLCVPILGARSTHGHCLGSGAPRLAPLTTPRPLMAWSLVLQLGFVHPRVGASGLCRTNSPRRCSDPPGQSWMWNNHWAQLWPSRTAPSPLPTPVHPLRPRSQSSGRTTPPWKGLWGLLVSLQRGAALGGH